MSRGTFFVAALVAALAVVPGRADAAAPVVVVDPGHDRLANLSTEPNGPGSATRKIYDGGGTHGVVTGIAEPDLTLAVSLRLRELLQRAGVKVVMTRTRTSGESMGTSPARGSQTARTRGSSSASMRTAPRRATRAARTRSRPP